LSEELHAFVKITAIDLENACLGPATELGTDSRCNRATGRSGQHPTGIAPFNIVIIFRGQNYNERGNTLLRFIAAGEPGR
jgi:hypothetical protein